MTDFATEERNVIRITVKEKLDRSPLLYSQDVAFVPYILIGSHSYTDISQIPVQLFFANKRVPRVSIKNLYVFIVVFSSKIINWIKADYQPGLLPVISLLTAFSASGIGKY